MDRIEDVDWMTVDFVDFGAGIGGSLASAEKRTGGRGVGIELRPHKVEQARLNGRWVVQGDIFDLPPSVSVRYVTIDNVLEHLPTREMVRMALESAADIATEFIYIRHPSFEDEAYLASLGLKQYWADWKDHPSHIQLAEFMRMAHALDACSCTMHPVRVAFDSDDSTILPIGAPPDQHQYEAAKHGTKPSVVFDRPVYYAWDIVIRLDPSVDVRLNYLLDPETTDRRPQLLIKHLADQRSVSTA